MKVAKNGAGLKGLKGVVLTLGNFDGIHIGHRKILEKVAARAHALGVPSVVYTFDPHPVKVVAPHRGISLILDAEDKKRLIEGFGIDCLVLAKFTREFASKHPREFVEEVIVRKLAAVEVWVGHDFSFGHGKSGTVEYLKELSREFGFRVNVIPAYRKKGAVVSSSRIRALVKEGSVREASLLLGRYYAVKGAVVRGKDIGKSIGFPTANLRPASELIPAKGVYAAFATVGGKRREAVVNIGVAPTFGPKELAVEVHILGYSANLYRKKMAVAFVRRLRDERPFKSVEELVAQIKKDVSRADRILGAGDKAPRS